MMGEKKNNPETKNVQYIKYKDMRVLTRDREIIYRWKEYCKELLSEKFPKEAVDRVEWNLGMVNLIRKEMWSAIRKIRK